MNDYQFDLHRIFFGDELPLLYLAEVAFRTVVMYVYSLGLLRLLGKRGIRQLTFFEFALIISLGSAVGDVMFYDDVPLLHGMVVVTVVILLQHLLAVITERNTRIERVIESCPTRLITDGVLDLQALKKEKMSQAEVYSWLREHGISNLAEVHKAYLEPSGVISVLRHAEEENRPGLLLLPPEDSDFRSSQPGETVPEDDHYACYECGRTHPMQAQQAFPPCPCERPRWTRATTRNSAAKEHAKNKAAPQRGASPA